MFMLNRWHRRPPRGPPEAQCAGSARYFGNLFPFALNFSPNSVSGPVPLGLVWQSPHALPVVLANSVVAVAGRVITNDAAPTITPTAAVPQTRVNVFPAFIFILGLSCADVAQLLGYHIQGTRSSPCEIVQTCTDQHD